MTEVAGCGPPSMAGDFFRERSVSEKPEKETPPEIEIDRRLCKGCGICVEFCPKTVLVMEGAYPVVVDLEACTRCQLCDFRCPDFAIRVK